MGRSVDYLTRATKVTYIQHEPYEVENFIITFNGIEKRCKGYDENKMEEWGQYKTENNSIISFEEWCFLHLEECKEGEIDDDSAQMAWDDLVANITYGLLAKYPSLAKCDRWDGRETRIFLHNNLVEIGISEYCGLVSISIRPNEYGDNYTTEGLAHNWINQNWNGIQNKLSEFCTLLNRVGGFSDGTSVYEKQVA